MPQAYTPALQVDVSSRVEKVRELPLPGQNLVNTGDAVAADTPVLRADLPGDLTIIRVADRLGFDPEEVVPAMKVKTGDRLEKGQVICSLKTFFGLIDNTLNSHVEGTVEFFTPANAHLGVRHAPIPLTVSAYVSGRVIAVEEGKSVTIETHGALIQGIFGVGGERRGRVHALSVPASRRVEPEDLKEAGSDLRGCVIIGGSCFSFAALQEAARLEAAAVVTGSVDSETLFRYVGKTISVSVTGDEQIPFSLIVTEGFGLLPISERVIALAKEFEGLEASVNGATQVRAGAMRPEVIIPHQRSHLLQAAGSETKALVAQARVRIIRVPYFGRLGTIESLPHAPEVVPSGASVRVVQVKLDSGDTVTVARANVELI